MEATYEEFIQNILETRGRFACEDEYHERHHIKPKCLGGNNDEDNLIDLFAREHFIAHKLLALENPENIKLVYAWNSMCNSKNGDYEITPEEYEELRIAFAQTSFTKETRQKMSKAQKASWTEERREEQSKKVSGKNNPNFGKHMSEENKKKIGELHRGAIPSEETRKKLSEFKKAWWTDDKKEEWSEKISGENHPMFGKHHSEESKKKNSESHKGLYVGSNHPQAKKVIRLFDFKIYDCGKDAAIDNDVNYSTFKNKCQKHKDFMYYDEWLTEKNDLENNKK